VVFVSGNMPFKTEIAPVLIVAALEGFNYAQAAAIAVVLLSSRSRCSSSSICSNGGVSDMAANTLAAPRGASRTAQEDPWLVGGP